MYQWVEQRSKIGLSNLRKEKKNRVSFLTVKGKVTRMDGWMARVKVESE